MNERCSRNNISGQKKPSLRIYIGCVEMEMYTQVSDPCIFQGIDGLSTYHNVVHSCHFRWSNDYVDCWKGCRLLVLAFDLKMLKIFDRICCWKENISIQFSFTSSHIDNIENYLYVGIGSTCHAAPHPASKIFRMRLL